MQNTESKRIAALLAKTYTGEAWHGPAVMEVLSEIGPAQWETRVGDSHSVIELVAHMITWRRFVIKQLQGDAAYKVTDAENFPTISTPDATEWGKQLALLDHSQMELVALLENTADEKLEEIVPGRSYSFYGMLHGIIQHDLYHLGQVVLLGKYL